MFNERFINQKISDAPVYPHNLHVIYPKVNKQEKSLTPAFVTTSQYPVFDLCKDIIL